MNTAVAFFNNKGGVGKTTLACNYAAWEASQGRRVLVVDLDPQCNSTQLVLSDEQWTDIYGDPPASDDRTVMKVLRAIRAGDSNVISEDPPIESSDRFGVDVLPGHPSLSVLEDILGEAWSDLRGGRPAGARRTAWLGSFREDLGDRYDLIVVDVSPSLGAINRSALVGSDTFITPMSADLFSLYALDNIAQWMDRWLTEYDIGLAASRAELEQVGFADVLPEDLAIRNGYLGYTVQQYVSRTSKGEVRRIRSYDRHREEIPARAQRLAPRSPFSGELEVGTVPNMFSMIPLAQTMHAPIISLRKEDGLRGAQPSQQQRYAEQLHDIFTTISSRALSEAPDEAGEDA